MFDILRFVFKKTAASACRCCWTFSPRFKTHRLQVGGCLVLPLFFLCVAVIAQAVGQLLLSCQFSRLLRLVTKHTVIPSSCYITTGHDGLPMIQPAWSCGEALLYQLTLVLLPCQRCCRLCCGRAFSFVGKLNSGSFCSSPSFQNSHVFFGIVLLNRSGQENLSGRLILLFLRQYSLPSLQGELSVVAAEFSTTMNYSFALLAGIPFFFKKHFFKKIG